MCGNFTGSILQTADSGYVYISSNYSQPSPGYSFVRLDKYGDTVYTKPYIYSNLSFQLGVSSQSLIVNANGEYVACGNAINTSNNTNGYVVAFNALGDTLWTKEFAGSGSEYLTGLHQDSSGDYWLCGSTTSQGNGMSDFWLMRLDSDFNVQWDSVYGTSQSEGIVSSAMTPDGGFVMSGRSGNYPYVVKVDSTGDPEWQYAYAAFDGYGYVNVMPDSGYIVACEKILSASDEEGCLVRLTPGGSVQWSTYVGFTNSFETLTTRPLIVGGEIIIAGSSRLATGYYRGYLVKADRDGNATWQRTYTITQTAHHYIYDLAATNDNGFVMAGSCHIGTQDAWLLKVDSFGCDSIGCDGVGIIPSAEHGIMMSVYPNPANENVSVEYAEAPNDASVEILNIEGQIIDRIFFENGRAVISVSSYAEGMYFFRLVHDGVLLVSEKLIIQR